LPSQRPYLVFFRSGPKSLHPKLLAEDPARNWDCAINYWASPEPPDNLADIYCTGGGNKFEGFLEFWRNDPRARGYRYYFLLDDDVYFQPGDISRFLELCEKHGTELAQPSLKWSTYYNLNVTVRNPVCQLRRVSFVEVMAACLSPATLEKLLPTFSISRSTWGIDWAWSCLMKDSGTLHVVDAIAIDHTKPVDVNSGALYQMLKAQGVSFSGELLAARREYGEFGATRTLFGRHVYRKGMPQALGAVLVHVFETLKFFARLQKKLARRRYRLALRARSHALR
jgi:hypothetical protein